MGGHFDLDTKKQRKEALEKETKEENFWQDLNHANEVNKELAVLNKQINLVETLENEIKDNLELIELISEEEYASLNLETLEKELEELEDCFYKAKETYMKLYQKYRQTGEPFALHNYLFGDRQMYAALNILGNL